MNKPYLIIFSILIINSLQAMDRKLDSMVSKKRLTPETTSPDSSDKRIKTGIHQTNRVYNPAPLLIMTSFAVSKGISNGKISKADFETQTPQDIHPHVMRFLNVGNDLDHLLNISITGENSESIPGSDISSFLTLGANPNIICDEKQTKDQKMFAPNKNALLSAAIIAGNREHIKALASHPKTDLENECFQKANNLAKERPLITAIIHGKEAGIIETLILHGANVNVTSQYYVTDRKKSALSLLCTNSKRYKKEEHYKVMQLLLNNGANPYSVTINTVPLVYREDTFNIVQKYYHL